MGRSHNLAVVFQLQFSYNIIEISGYPLYEYIESNTLLSLLPHFVIYRIILSCLIMVTSIIIVSFLCCRGK